MGNEIKKQAKAVNKQADKLYKEGMYTDAIKLYVESVKLMKEAGELKDAENYQKELEKAVMKRSEEINNEGDRLMKEKQYEKAMEIYSNALNLLEKAGPKWVKKKGKEFQNELDKSKEAYAEVLKDQSDELVKKKDWDGAIDIYKTILKTINVDIDKRLYTKVQSNQKKVYELWADEVNKEGDALYKEKRYEEAIDKYTKAVELINKSEDTKKQKKYKKELSSTFAKHAEIVNNHGDKLMKNDQFLEAAKFYAESVQIAQEAEDQKLVNSFTKEMLGAYEAYAKVINDKGDKLYKEKKFDEAATIYKESVDAAKNSQDQKLIQRFQGEYEKAMEKWADEVNKEGDTAMKAKKYDEAFNHYKQSVEIIKQTTDAKKIKKYTDEFKDACEKLSKEINSEGDEAYKAGEYEKAYKLYNQSVNLMEAVGNARLLKRFSKERNKALAKLNE